MASTHIQVLLATCIILLIEVNAQGLKKCAQSNYPITTCNLNASQETIYTVISAYQTSGEIDLNDSQFKPHTSAPCSVSLHACDVPNAPTVVPKGLYPYLAFDIYRNCGSGCSNTAEVNVIWYGNTF